MRKVVSILAFVAVMAFVGCEKSTKNEVGGAPGPKVVPGPMSGPGGPPGAVIPDRSTISFVGTKAEGKHDGGFKSFTGSVKPASGDITTATISVEIDIDSMFTDQEKLTTHLKSPDFFDVKKYPKASFTSTAIKAEKKDDNTHVITGELTLHGTKKELSFPAKVTTADSLLTLESTFTIDRTEYGIAYAPDKVNKTVTIKVALKAARQ